MARPSSSSSAAAPAPVRALLPNGMPVIVQEHRGSDVVALQLWVRAGARDETASELGLAHYLEHMLFKGTATRPPGFVDRDIEGVGGRINAATSWDYTYYHALLPAARAVAGIEMLADIAVNASLDGALLDQEKQVVLEEMRLNDDNPRRFLSRRLFADLFPGHPYGRQVIGTPDLGCSSADPFSAQELDGQARRLFKRLLAARTARIEPIVVSSFENVCRDTVVEPHHADLFDPTRPGELRPSGASFRRFVDATSAMTDARAFSAGPELFAVWFDDTEGRQALLVAWSEVPGGQTMSLIVSRTFESAVVTDYAGNTSTIPIANGDLRVTINATPVLIHLVPPATPPPPLGIESVSPPTGNTAGGTIVTIVGTSFAAGATVQVGGAMATSVLVLGATTIQAVAPAHAAETVDVIVTNPDGVTARITDAFTYVEGPSRRRRSGRR